MVRIDLGLGTDSSVDTLKSQMHLFDTPLSNLFASMLRIFVCCQSFDRSIVVNPKPNKLLLHFLGLLLYVFVQSVKYEVSMQPQFFATIPPLTRPTVEESS